MADSWNIGVAAWIIQDGNYPDFSVGQVVEFAVEFSASELAATRSGEKRADWLDAETYRVSADVVYQSEHTSVLDFGILAYCYRGSGVTEEITVGQKIIADLSLGIDPYFYFEFLSKVEDFPALVYTWRIDGISMQTAPHIVQEPELGRYTWVRDESKLGYGPVERTNAWLDDDGGAEYILHCTRLNIEPKRNSQTAL